jgi:hypothetical protein
VAPGWDRRHRRVVGLGRERCVDDPGVEVGLDQQSWSRADSGEQPTCRHRAARRCCIGPPPAGLDDRSVIDGDSAFVDRDGSAAAIVHRERVDRARRDRFDRAAAQHEAMRELAGPQPRGDRSAIDLDDRFRGGGTRDPIRGVGIRDDRDAIADRDRRDVATVVGAAQQEQHHHRRRGEAQSADKPRYPATLR